VLGKQCYMLTVVGYDVGMNVGVFVGAMVGFTVGAVLGTAKGLYVNRPLKSDVLLLILVW
jgi:hypothetical protein